MNKTDDKLRARLTKAAETMQRAKDERDRLILEASKRGMSRREVGKAVGLTGSGVQNVVSTRSALNGTPAESREGSTTGSR